MYYAEKRKKVCQLVAAGQSRPGPVRLDGAAGGQGHGEAVRDLAG